MNLYIERIGVIGSLFGIIGDKAGINLDDMISIIINSPITNSVEFITAMSFGYYIHNFSNNVESIDRIWIMCQEILKDPNPRDNTIHNDLLTGLRSVISDKNPTHEGLRYMFEHAEGNDENWNIFKERLFEYKKFGVIGEVDMNKYLTFPQAFFDLMKYLKSLGLIESNEFDESLDNGFIPFSFEGSEDYSFVPPRKKGNLNVFDIKKINDLGEMAGESVLREYRQEDPDQVVNSNGVDSLGETESNGFIQEVDVITNEDGQGDISSVNAQDGFGVEVDNPSHRHHRSHHRSRHHHNRHNAYEQPYTQVPQCYWNVVDDPRYNPNLGAYPQTSFDDDDGDLNLGTYPPDRNGQGEVKKRHMRGGLKSSRGRYFI